MSLHVKRSRRGTGLAAALALAAGTLAVVIGRDFKDQSRATREDIARSHQAGSPTVFVQQSSAAQSAAVRPQPPIRDGFALTRPILYEWEPYVDLVVIAKAVEELETVYNTTSGQPVSPSERRTNLDWQGVRPVVFEVEEVLADRGAWSDVRWIVVRVFDDEPEYLPNPCANVEMGDVVSGARGLLLLTPEDPRAIADSEVEQSPMQLSWKRLHASALQWAEEHTGRTLASGMELWLRFDGDVARAVCSGASEDIPGVEMSVEEIREYFARQR